MYLFWVEEVWQLLIKANIHLHPNPAVLLCVYPREMKTYPQKHLYKNVHSSSVRNSSKLETAQVSISRRIGKQTGMPAQWNTTQLRNVLRPYKTWMMLSVAAHAFDSSSWQLRIAW